MEFGSCLSLLAHFVLEGSSLFLQCRAERHRGRGDRTSVFQLSAVFFLRCLTPVVLDTKGHLSDSFTVSEGHTPCQGVPLCFPSTGSEEGSPSSCASPYVLSCFLLASLRFQLSLAGLVWDSSRAAAGGAAQAAQAQSRAPYAAKKLARTCSREMKHTTWSSYCPRNATHMDRRGLSETAIPQPHPISLGRFVQMRSCIFVRSETKSSLHQLRSSICEHHC